MSSMLRTLEELRPLRDPVLLVGFAGQFGTSGAAAVEYLVEEWDATPVAEIDPDECFDYTVRRPIVRTVDGERVIEWPLNRIYVASPHGPDRDFLLLPGIEPHMRWGAFIEAVADVAQALGCHTAVVFGAWRGGIPHTRPTPLRLTGEAGTSLARLFGLEASPSRYEGPVGISSVLASALAATGIEVASLNAMTPAYVPADPDPAAVLALVCAIDAAFGTSTPRGRLEEAKAELDSATNEAVASAPPLAATVESLEQQYDWIRGAPAPKTGSAREGGELPSGPELVAELDRFLRGRGEQRSR